MRSLVQSSESEEEGGPPKKPKKSVTWVDEELGAKIAHVKKFKSRPKERSEYYIVIHLFYFIPLFKIEIHNLFWGVRFEKKNRNIEANSASVMDPWQNLHWLNVQRLMVH